jgi:hypothetical protein
MVDAFPVLATGSFDELRGSLRDWKSFVGSELTVLLPAPVTPMTLQNMKSKNVLFLNGRM